LPFKAVILNFAPLLPNFGHFWNYLLTQSLSHTQRTVDQLKVQKDSNKKHVG